MDSEYFGTPRIRVVRDQIGTTQGPQVNCVRQNDFWYKIRSPPCGPPPSISLPRPNPVGGNSPHPRFFDAQLGLAVGAIDYVSSSGD